MHVKPASAPPFKNPTIDYSNEPLVQESSTTVYRYNADGTGERTSRAVLHLQSDAAVRQFGVLSFAYAAGNESVELHYVRVRKTDGTLIATDSSAAQDLPAEVTRQAPLYSDQHQLQVPVRSLAVGDRLEYEVVVHMHTAEAPGQFWDALTFDKQAVTLDQQVELHVPSDKRLTVLSPSYPPIVHTQNGQTAYLWHSTELRPTVAPPGGSAPPEDDTPAARPMPDVAWTTFADWAAVGNWYRSLAADRAAPTDALRAKAAALTAGASTDDEKIRRIYSFVSMQIRYIGVDFGIGRFQPHAAAEVLSNGYGDCKDKHTLLAALLAAAGFHADPVLIGESIELDRDLPAPNSFNHVITAVEQPDGKRLWLDSTAEVAPPGMLLANLRDKDALLIPTGSGAVPALLKTPAAPPFSAYDRYDSHATLSADGTLSAHFDVALRGDVELFCRLALFMGGRGSWSAVGQSISSNLGFGGTVSAFTPIGVDTPDKPLQFSYDYKRDSYADWPNHRILSVIPVSFFSGATYSKAPVDPIQLGAPRLESAKSTIVLPDGFSIPTLPTAIHAKSTFGTFDITYSLHGQEFVTKERLEFRAASLPASQWKEYNTFIGDITANTGMFITLAQGAPADKSGSTQLSSAAPSAPPAPVAWNTDAGAQGLVEEAVALVRTGDVKGAQAKIDAAQLQNPDQPGLWTAKGLLAGQQRNFKDAEADLRKECSLHPGESNAMLPTILWAQLGQKHSADAIATLDAMRKLKPDNIALTRQEAALLTGETRHEEAISLLESAALRNPADKWTMLALGNAQFAAGRLKEGQITLETTLENADDPGILNDAAYQLADHNLDLPVAAEDAQKALSLLDTAIGKISLDALKPEDLGRQNLLGATWDTRGWIAYLQGNNTAAESYLHAAWVQSERPEVGYHYGMLLEKEGKSQQAAEIYTLADAGTSNSNPASPDILAMRKRRDALIAAGHKVNFSQPGSTMLAEIRTVRLPLLTKEYREANFFVLASPTAVAVTFIDGDSLLKPHTKAIQDAITGNRSTLPLPTGSGAHLLRRGVLSCSSLIGYCQFTMYLPQETHLPQPTVSIAKQDEASK